MNTSNPLALIFGGLISLITAALVTSFTQRSTSDRERRSRTHERWLKMVDFQIENLRSVQDAMIELARIVSRDIDIAEKNNFPDINVSPEMGLASANLLKLLVRIRDDEVRESVKLYNDSVTIRMFSIDTKLPHLKLNEFMSMSRNHFVAQEAVGKLLREYCDQTVEDADDRFALTWLQPWKWWKT